jgi:hypothetical protein
MTSVQACTSGKQRQGDTGSKPRRPNALILCLGLVLLLLALQPKALAQSSTTRLHVAVAPGVYNAGGVDPDLVSRSLFGLHVEAESLWLGSRNSLTFGGQANFEPESGVVAEIMLALGGAVYLRMPVRPESARSAEFSLSQDISWNVRTGLYLGLGRHLMSTLKLRSPAEVITETIVLGVQVLVLVPFNASWSAVVGFDAHQSVGIGRYDLSGQTILGRFGFELGL